MGVCTFNRLILIHMNFVIEGEWHEKDYSIIFKSLFDNT